MNVTVTGENVTQMAVYYISLLDIVDSYNPLSLAFLLFDGTASTALGR